MRRLLRKNQKALVFELLVAAAMAVVIFFALMNIGTYINGTVSDNLIDSYGTATSRTTFENKTVLLLNNISYGFDDNIDIMIIAAIITVITIPLAAVIAIRRLM